MSDQKRLKISPKKRRIRIIKNRSIPPLFPLARTILVFKQQQWEPGNQIIQVHEYTRILLFRRGGKKRKKEKEEKSSLYECCMHNCRGNILARTFSLSPLSLCCVPARLTAQRTPRREINAYRPEVYSHNVSGRGKSTQLGREGGETLVRFSENCRFNRALRNCY